MKKPTTFDIYWAAGIYEGEGSIYNNGGCIGIHVTQKDTWILQRLRRLFGGSVSGRMKSDSAGEFYIHRWLVSGPRARGFIYTIYSLLSPRRKAQALKHLTLSS